MSIRASRLSFNPRDVDRKWQKRWEKDKLYKVSDGDPRPKWYEMTMYPYPSGDTHIGHWYAMAPSDAHARYKRMQGYNVLHPMGFDAFGLPAENAAIKHKVHPYTWTMKNIKNMKRQLMSMGTIYDWSREIHTCDPIYYKWNQWFFLKFYEAGLAYRAKAPVNWCPSCQTVLANEQVKEGKCERCESAVVHKDLEQWFFKITKYAEELLDFSALIDWPDRIKSLQTNWIGRSDGVELSFDISHLGKDMSEIRTFTTRIDTIYGATFMVLAPEHPLLSQLTLADHRETVEKYVNAARKQTEIERLSTDREKTGVFTGAYARNRLNDEYIPIYVADYVLASYGTGAVMGVPAHDERDFAFAQKYKIDIREVIAPDDKAGEKSSKAFLGPGHLVNSGSFTGLSDQQGKERIAEYISNNEWGYKTTSYRFRDWLISRQRYWGTPIPIIYCGSCGDVPVPEKDLPVLLPEDAEFRPMGESPLKYHKEFVSTPCPKCGEESVRETDTMDTFVDSSWYQLRYTLPNDMEAPFDRGSMEQWNPVNQYTGGAEHAVMHLLYSRFFTKALRDMGLIDFGEPFLRLYNQGHIIADRHKMSKSRGNVVTPDPYVATLGADVVRIYLMFLGPWSQGGEWSDSGLHGMVRWVNRVWELAKRDSTTLKADELTAEKDSLKRITHKTIRKVTQDIERFHFNTALAALMEFTNALNAIWREHGVDRGAWDHAIDVLLILLAPIAPHFTEELWEYRGRKYSIHNQPIPVWDPRLVEEEQVVLIVQVNGKLRDKFTISVTMDEAEVTTRVLESEKIRGYLEGKEIKKVIYVPQKLINLVLA